MLISIIRAIIIYAFVIAAVRLMGKRQIGELQPTELVVTILLSEIAAIPMQDNNVPILNSVVAVMVLIAFELVSSYISLKSTGFRTLMQGNSVFVIKNGVIDQKEMQRLRFTIDDLLSSLRQKDIFDIAEVQYAILETNGQLSVMLKPEQRNVTAKMMNTQESDSGIPCMVICNGKIIDKNFSECNMNEAKLHKLIKKKDVDLNDILIMTIDKDLNTILIKKEV